MWKINSILCDDEKRTHFIYLEAAAPKSVFLFFSSSFCVSLIYALARACFTSAHKCTLLGVMFSLFPASLSYTETNIAKTSVWQLARPTETHLAYENARASLASANPVACHEISENHWSHRHNNTWLERIWLFVENKKYRLFFFET